MTFTTNNIVKIIANNVGSTCTIIYDLFKQNNITISNQTAGLILSSIISDTVLLKSSITTEQDIKTVEELAEITGLNYTKYGYDMLLAGTKFQMNLNII